MRILLINKFYFRKGGADQQFFEVKELLEARGHTVIPFAMQHPDNEPTPFAKYFVSEVDFSRVRFTFSGLRAIGRMVYSFEARKKLRRLIRATRPEIAHCHNIYHQLSPSILHELKRAHIPVVMTCHDYNLLSPNYMMFHDGQIHECGQSGSWSECLHRRCVKGSFWATLAAVAALRLHRAMHVYEQTINVAIAPSRFLLEKIRASGIRFRRTVQIPHPAQAIAGMPTENRTEIFFVGRLVEEKGADHVIRALARTSLPVRIIGSGPEEERLRILRDELKATHIRFDGHLHRDALDRMWSSARLCIVPSLWYENYPTVILEAFAHGVPVIAYATGGIPEMVTEERGVLIPRGDIEALRSAVEAVYTDERRVAQMSANARAFASTQTPEAFYTALMNVYASCLH